MQYFLQTITKCNLLPKKKTKRHEKSSNADKKKDKYTSRTVF